MLYPRSSGEGRVKHAVASNGTPIRTSPIARSNLS
jgi:hypothetical protein